MRALLGTTSATLRLAALAALAMLAGCGGTDACKQDTVFVSYHLPAEAAGADSIDIALTVADGSAQQQSVPRKSHGESGSTEIGFQSYPNGRSFTLTLRARAGDAALATGTRTATATTGCTSIEVSLAATGE